MAASIYALSTAFPALLYLVFGDRDSRLFVPMMVIAAIASGIVFLVFLLYVPSMVSRGRTWPGEGDPRTRRLIGVLFLIIAILVGLVMGLLLGR